jgi:hypothetical protein
MIGYVYILINHSFPNLVKIGKTANDPLERADQLDSTGVPTPFVVVYARKFLDCHKAEKAMHEYFVEYRSRKNREFFEVSATQAITKIQSLEGGVEDGSAPGVGEQYFFVYLAKFGFLRRFGLFKAVSDDAAEKPVKQEVEVLSRKLKDYYNWNSGFYFEFTILCRPLENYRNTIESMIIEMLKKGRPKTSKFYAKYDNQTLIKEHDWPSFPDTFDSDVRELYFELVSYLGDFVEESDVNGEFERKRRLMLRGNF